MSSCVGQWTTMRFCLKFVSWARPPCLQSEVSLNWNEILLGGKGYDITPLPVMGGDSFHILGDSTKPFLSGLEMVRLNLCHSHYLYLVDSSYPQKQTGNKKCKCWSRQQIITCNFPKWEKKSGGEKGFLLITGFWYVRPHSRWRALQPAPLTPSQFNSQSRCCFSMEPDARTPTLLSGSCFLFCGVVLTVLSTHVSKCDLPQVLS